MDVETRPGLRLEVTGRELSAARPAAEPAPRPRRGWYPLGLLAVLLLVFLMVPMGATLAWSLDGDAFFGNFRDILTDAAALDAAWHSVLWVGIALGLVALGYGIALLSRLVDGLWRVLLYVLILPFGISALVSGAVFRMIFDPNPERGMASALFGGEIVWLGPGLIWLVLASAFAWTWLGFIVVLFRAGLDANPGRRPGPVTAIVVLTVLVAAIRVFDLVLIAAPASVHNDVDVVGLHWWRMVSRSTEDGGPAALAVLLFVIVAAVAVFGTRAGRATGAARPDPQAKPAPAPHRLWSSIIGIGVGVFWLLPVIVLVATALHDPAAAGSRGWWSTVGLGFGSFEALGETWLWPALAGNLLLVALATALVVAAAVPAAYLLVWGGLPRWLSGALTMLLVVLAVAPVQMYAGPLGEVFSAWGLAGSRAPLALVHAAAGLPFAVLVLRTAFVAAPVGNPVEQRPSLDALWRRGRYRPALIAVVVLELILVWNDFIVGFLISGLGPSPHLLLWGEARQFGTSAGTVAAASVVASVIPVAVLLATWPRVVAGLTGGVLR